MRAHTDERLGDIFDGPGQRMLLAYQAPPPGFEPAEGVREWNPYYGAPGYALSERAIADQYVTIPQARLFDNPMDWSDGLQGGDGGYHAMAARWIRSQESRESFA